MVPPSKAEIGAADNSTFPEEPPGVNQIARRVGFWPMIWIDAVVSATLVETGNISVLVLISLIPGTVIFL
jgi:hypothetical protein